MAEARTLDLHRVVPEPPDGLLALEQLHHRLRRRRFQQVAASTAVVAVIVVGSILVATQAGSHEAHRPTAPALHANGNILFTKTSPGPFKGLPNSSLYALSPAGGPPIQVTHQSGRITMVASSPDGRRIAYVQETYSTIPHPHVNAEIVHVASADGSGDQAIFHCAASSCSQLAWSPDGRRLLINDTTTSRIFEPNGRLHRICVDGCPGRQVMEASWSPDGSRLAFTDSKPVRVPGGTAYVSSIAVVDADGPNLTILTNRRCAENHAECSDDAQPSWSPDGSRIAFTRSAPARLQPVQEVGGIVGPPPARVETMSPEGTHLSQLSKCATGCTVDDLTWAPTGARLAEVVDSIDQPRSLVVLGPAGTRTLTTPIRHTGWRYPPTLAWSPDGKQLALYQRSTHTSAALYTCRVQRRSLTAPVALVSAARPPLAWLPARG